LDAIINVFKPVGPSSAQVVNIIKKITHEKKIGHIGTLDPAAEGVLPLFLGKMTKLVPYFNGCDKHYHAQIRLGARSSTLDREGTIEECPIPQDCSDKKILEAVNCFLGDIEQIPPMHSAVKISGKPLYKYARKGITVERKPRQVTIFSIKNIDSTLPNLQFDIHCSKGTYIRTLAADIGEKLNTGGYLLALRRTQCGDFFTEANSVQIDQIEKLEKDDLQKTFINPMFALPSWHRITISVDYLLERICHGATILVSQEFVTLSAYDETSNNAFVEDQNGRLISAGTLEFSQDSPWKFNPLKVLI